MDIPIEKFIVVGLIIYSVSLHELGHAWAATYFGDPTPGRHGRLTWNPLVQLHPVYSFVFPLLTYLMTGWPLGWAFCPIDPSRFRKPLRDRALTALAGPAVNFAIALFCLVMLWIEPLTPVTANGPSSNLVIFFGLGLFNLMLGLFNLLPMPGLDGYDVLRPILPLNLRKSLDDFRRMGFLPLMLAIFLGSRLFWIFFAPLLKGGFHVLPERVDYWRMVGFWFGLNG